MAGRYTVVERRQHPGWTDRFKLDPVQVAAQGPEYTEACALLIRDSLLRRWVNDPGNARWHPGPEFRLRLEIEGEYQRDHVTWLVGELDAVFRPPNVPEDVLEHMHSGDCAHERVPFADGHCCTHCGNLGTPWRLCPFRCVATGYAAHQVAQFYPPPGLSS